MGCFTPFPTHELVNLQAVQPASFSNSRSAIPHPALHSFTHSRLFLLPIASCLVYYYVTYGPFRKR
jgi:hypothetical protein